MKKEYISPTLEILCIEETLLSVTSLTGLQTEESFDLTPDSEDYDGEFQGHTSDRDF
jgi:hypothetical protein